MKKFIIHFILFLVPLLLIFAVLEFCLRNRTETNEILAKKSLIENQKDIEVLFFGNSHGRNAFDPSRIKKPSLNLCIGGSTLFYNRFLIEETLSSHSNVQSVVLNISYQTMFYDMSLLPDKKKAYEFWHYLGADSGIKKISPSGLSILYTIGLKKALNSLKSDFSQNSENWIQQKGYKMDQKVIPQNQVGSLSKERIKAHHSLMNLEMLSNQLQELSKIDSICKAKDVQLILALIPVHEEYKKLKLKKYSVYNTEIEKFAESKNIIVLDFDKTNDLSSTDFADPDHTNENGSKKLSASFNQLL